MRTLHWLSVKVTCSSTSCVSGQFHTDKSSDCICVWKHVYVGLHFFHYEVCEIITKSWRWQWTSWLMTTFRTCWKLSTSSLKTDCGELEASHEHPQSSHWLVSNYNNTNFLLKNVFRFNTIRLTKITKMYKNSQMFILNYLCV